MTQLTREQISDIDACCTGPAAHERYVTETEAAGLCTMALALLDVAELVPGEGYVVERVRSLVGADRPQSLYYRMLHEQLAQCQRDLAAATASLAEARALFGTLSSSSDPMVSMIGKAAEIIAGDRRARLRAALVSLADAAERLLDAPRVLPDEGSPEAASAELRRILRSEIASARALVGGGK